MKKELKKEIEESQNLGRTERRKKERILRKKYNDKSIKIKFGRTFNKGECLSRKQRRELLKDKDLLKELLKIIKKYFPDLTTLFSKLTDKRHKSYITYKMRTIIMTRLLALLDGRDAESVKDFLVNHMKIKVVTRDRASAYATAINKILPNCMQVADRFHLFQNLIEYLKEIFYKEIPDKMFIKNNEIIEKVKKVPSELVNIDQNILNKLIYDNTPAVDEKGNIIIFDNKRRDLDSKQYI